MLIIAKLGDISPQASEVLFALISQKRKKSITDIAPNSSFKDLVSGKSTLQNEILGDLDGEFGNVLQEKAEETPCTKWLKQSKTPTRALWARCRLV